MSEEDRTASCDVMDSGCTPLGVRHVGLTASEQEQTGHRPLRARVDGLYIGV